MSVVIDFEGFLLSSGHFIVKELAFNAVKGYPFSGMCTFQPPFPFEELPERQRLQYKWVSKNIHLIDFNKGVLPYSKFRNVLCFLFEIFPNIYVKGYEKRKFLEFLAGRKCYDLNDLKCPRMDQLVPTHSSCTIHVSDFKHCALAKVIVFGNFLKSL